MYSEFDFLAPRNQLFFSQIPQRRGEERSGNFVGVGGHTNVGINDGPKKENRIGSAEISGWKRLVKVVTATVNSWSANPLMKFMNGLIFSPLVSLNKTLN